MKNHYDGLLLDGEILGAKHPDFVTAQRRFSELNERQPSLIIRPHNRKGVVETIRFARSTGNKLAIRGAGQAGGYGAASSTKGGILLDMSRLNTVKIQDDTIIVDSGAIWSDVYAAAAEHRLNVVGPVAGSVGVAGFVLGGGHSIMSHRYGLGIDNLLSAAIVLSDGNIVTASAEEHRDLYWALRGCGDFKLGIVVELCLQAYPTTGPIAAGTLIYEQIDVEDGLRVFLDEIHRFHDHDHCSVVFVREGPDFQPTMHVTPFIMSPQRVSSTLAPLRPPNLKPIIDSIEELPNQHALSLLPPPGNNNALPRRVLAAGTLIPPPPNSSYLEMILEAWHTWKEHTSRPEYQTSQVWFEFFTLGPFKDIKASETSFNARQNSSYAVVHGRHASPINDEEDRHWVHDTVELIRNRAHVVGNIVQVTPNIAFGDESLEELYGSEAAIRLRSIQRRYDLDGFWI